MTEDKPNVPEQTEKILTRNDQIMTLHSRPKAQTYEEYEEKLLQHINLRWDLYYIGSALVDVNRRFCMLGNIFGFTPSNVIQKLANEEKLAIERHRGKIIAFPREKWHTLLNSIKDLDMQIEQQQRICDNSLTDAGIRIKPSKREPK